MPRGKEHKVRHQLIVYPKKHKPKSNFIYFNTKMWPRHSYTNLSNATTRTFMVYILLYLMWKKSNRLTIENTLSVAHTFTYAIINRINIWSSISFMNIL